MLGVKELLESPPHFVSPQGLKWWHEKELTHFAKSKKLDGITAWIVEHTDKRLTRVLVKNNEVICEETTYEGIACFIEMLWASENMEK